MSINSTQSDPLLGSILLAWLSLRFYDIPIRRWLEYGSWYAFPPNARMEIGQTHG